MSALAIVIAVVVGVASVLAIALIAWSLLRHVRATARAVSGIRTDLDRELSVLASEAQVMEQELARIADAGEELRRARIPRR